MTLPPLINCESISKSYGSQTLFTNLSFSVFRGDKIGVVGPNGSGKSTLLKALSGIEPVDSGIIAIQRNIRVGYVPQDSIFPDMTLEEILLKALEENKSIDEYERHVQAAITLGKMGFQDPAQKASSLSGGWKKRLDIAKAAVKMPDLLLLDEPTNHLDLDGILWLESFLKDAPFAYMIISHDRYFLENVTNRMVELNKSYPYGLFAVEGNYSNFLEKREDFLAGQQQYERSLASKVRREIEWLKQNPKARTTKSTARIKEAGVIIQELSDVKSRNKQSSAQIDFSATDRQLKKLLAATNIGKSLGGRHLFSGINLTLSTGTRLGIVGSNGTGKSTLLKLLMGQLTPDKGTIKMADGVKIAYFDQHREELPKDLTLRRALSPDSDRVMYRGQSIHVNGWARRFLFSQDRLDLPVSQLSGGEKARVLIARLMLQPADILLLDEPTNDLDIPTLEVLEESLIDFPGAVVMITHDRLMMDQVATSIVGLGSGGEEYLFADYSQWEVYKEQQEKKIKALQPRAVPEKMIPQKREPSAAPKKLSFKEKQELEQMERKIMDAEEAVAKCQAKLDSSDVAGDSSKLQEACNQLHMAQEVLEKLYARWQELEAKNQI